MAAPIPSIIVFSGRYIRDDMKAKLISSGHGIEVGYENGAIADRYELLKQRIYIELGDELFPLPPSIAVQKGEKAVCRQRGTGLEFDAWTYGKGTGALRAVPVETDIKILLSQYRGGRARTQTCSGKRSWSGRWPRRTAGSSSS